MPALRIEHPVPDFDEWKEVFDRDPIGRERSGVRRYQIVRPVDDRHYVMVDLELDTEEEAQALLASLRQLWAGAGSSVSSSQPALIVETTETEEY
jgi:hypothetical protein